MPLNRFYLPLALGALALSILPAGHVFASPTGQQLLQNLRMSQTLENTVLSGQLRQGREKYPFLLYLQGPVSTYQFTDSGEKVRLELRPGDSRLIKEGERVSGETFAQKVRGTDLTYEDIALRFLYWPNAEIVAEEEVGSFDCWKMWVSTNPGRSTYSGAYLWIAKLHGGLVKADCYIDKDLVKRFQVRSFQRIKGSWVMKSLDIESFRPGNSRRPVSRTKLEIFGEASQ